MPFSRGHSKLLVLLLAAASCLFYGSKGINVRSTLVTKRLRGFDTAQVTKHMEYSKWKQENPKHQRTVNARHLMENCTKDEFDMGKRKLVDSLHDVQNKIGNLRRASLGSKTCQLGLEVSINRTEKVMGYLAKNDFWHARKTLAKVIADVDACNSDLERNGEKVGSTQMQETDDSLKESLRLILTSRLCYYILSLNNRPPPNYSLVKLAEKMQPPSITTPDSESMPLDPYMEDLAHTSSPSPSPSPDSGPYNDFLNIVYDLAPALPPGSYGDYSNESFYEFWNSSAPVLSPSSYWDYSNESFYEFWNSSGPTLSPSFNWDYSNESFYEFWNSSGPTLSPNPYGVNFNDSFEDYSHGEGPSPSSRLGTDSSPESPDTPSSYQGASDPPESNMKD